MKKNFLLALSFLFVFTAISFAQEQTQQKREKGPSIEKRVDKMATDLGLSATEKTNLQTLLQKQEGDMKKFKAETDKESVDFKPKMKGLRKSQTAELKNLLGEEKYAKLQELRSQEKQKEEQKTE
jgi:hypothetical protein